MAEAMSDEDEIQAFMREIDKAQKMRRALVKLKHRLRVKLEIPCSATFKEYENFAPVGQPKNNPFGMKIATSRAKRDLYLIAGGIKCVGAEKGRMRFELCFSVGPRIHKGYEVLINYVENEGFRLVKYNLPEGLNVKTIIAKVPMKDFHDAIKFLQYIHACGCALFNRKEQVEKLKQYCADSEIDISVFSSCDVTYMEINFQSDILMLTSKTEMMSFVLKYAIDTHRPTEILYEKEDINQEDKSRLVSYFSDFVSFSLVEAFRCARHVKSQPESSQTESDKEALMSIDTIESVKRTQQNKASRSVNISPKKRLADKNRGELVLSQRIQELHSKSQRTMSKNLVISTQNTPEEDDESMFKISRGRKLIRAHKSLEEDVESRFKSTSPKSTSLHSPEVLEEHVQTTSQSTSSRHASIRVQKRSEHVESMSEGTSPRRAPIRVQKRSEHVETMPESTSPRHVSIRVQKRSEHVETMPESTSPRRAPIQVQKRSEHVETMPESTSPRHVSIRVQKRSEHVETMPESTSPRRAPIREQKRSEHVESMSEDTSPMHAPIREQKRSEHVETMPESISPRRASARVQKRSEHVESMSEDTSPRFTPIREQKRSLRVETLPKSTSPIRIATLAEKIPNDDDESRPIRTSLKQSLIHAQKMPANKFRPMVWFSGKTQKKDPKQEQHSFQKSSTPLRMPPEKQLTSDRDIEELSTIAGSDTNVQDLSSETQGDPVATSTPFPQRNIKRQNKILAVEGEIKSGFDRQTPFHRFSQIQLHKYHQTQLHQFVKMEGNQEAQERNKSTRTSPRKKVLISEQYRDEDEGNEDEGDRRGKEKKRKSGVNVHKDTPVPKRSPVKKTITRQSVVTGKRSRI